MNIGDGVVDRVTRIALQRRNQESDRPTDMGPIYIPRSDWLALRREMARMSWHKVKPTSIKRLRVMGHDVEVAAGGLSVWQEGEFAGFRVRVNGIDPPQIWRNERWEELIAVEKEISMAFANGVDACLTLATGERWTHSA